MAKLIEFQEERVFINGIEYVPVDEHPYENRFRCLESQIQDIENQIRSDYERVNRRLNNLETK